MLLTILFLALLFGFIGKFLGFAFKFSWGLIKVIFGAVVFPIVLISLVFSGLIAIAFPLLIIAGVIALIASVAKA
jgi:hypothetical protein